MFAYNIQAGGTLHTVDQNYRSASKSKERFVGVSDEDMVQLALAGNQGAYTELFNRYHYQLEVKFGKAISDRESVKDLVQKTFINTFANLHTFRYGAKFSTWIYRIATNLTRNEIKNVVRKQRFERFDQHVKTPKQYALRSKFLNPEEELCVRDMIDRAHIAIQELPKEERELLLMRSDQNLSYPEIVSATGYQMSAVKMKIHRARQTIIKKIGMNLS